MTPLLPPPVGCFQMGEVELSCLAYAKMYLHASQFPRCSVNGLLLSSSPAGAAVCITDCVPLLHSHLSLAPITQLALTQVSAPLINICSGKIVMPLHITPRVPFKYCNKDFISDMIFHCRTTNIVNEYKNIIVSLALRFKKVCESKIVQWESRWNILD